MCCSPLNGKGTTCREEWKRYLRFYYETEFNTHAAACDGVLIKIKFNNNNYNNYYEDIWTS